MACIDCEQLPDPVTGDCRLYLWAPPGGHTFAKLAGWPLGPGRSREILPAGRTVLLRIAGAALTETLVEMSGLLGEKEQEDVKCLLLPGDREPGFADFPKVEPLSRALARHSAGWLIALLGQDRLTSWFQPIMHADGAGIFAHEALLRGIDADGVVVSAGHIIAAANAAGLTFQTDLRARLSAVTRFGKSGLPGRLFVNFSPNALYDPAFCLRTTIARIDELGIDHDRVVFEVIESEQHHNLLHLKGILGHYRRHGFQVALDDFGSGYNSLRILDELLPDYVKIDMGLIRGISTNPTKQAIVGNLVDLSRKLGARTIAEGIEEPADAEWLRQAGVAFLQGYLFGRPAPVPATAG
ncbi:MAG: EAL domain-containing protein [Thalassobaculales bacterium]